MSVRSLPGQCAGPPIDDMNWIELVFCLFLSVAIVILLAIGCAYGYFLVFHPMHAFESLDKAVR